MVFLQRQLSKARGLPATTGYYRSEREVFGVLCRDLTLPVSIALLKSHCFLYVHMCLQVSDGRTPPPAPSFTAIDNASRVSELPTDKNMKEVQLYLYSCLQTFQSMAPLTVGRVERSKGGYHIVTRKQCEG